MPQPNDSWTAGILALIAFCILSSVVASHRARSQGVNDFVPLYAAATLLPDGGLYGRDRLREASIERAGLWSDQHGFIRLPFYAAFLWPLTLADYSTAAAFWQALLLAAVAGFIAWWQPGSFRSRLALCAVSVPLFCVALNLQDVPFLLLILALSERLRRAGRDGAAGLVFSLCAIKPHLFLLTPVLILGRRAWRFGGGLFAGGAALAAISFAVAGWDWPAAFLASATNPTFSPHLGMMPNLHGALAEAPGAPVIEAALTAAIIAMTWIVSRRQGFSMALACSLTGGLLISRHSYIADAAILLPAGLTILAESKSSVTRALALAVLLPPTWALVLSGAPYSAVAVALIVALCLALFHESLRQPEAAPDEPRQVAGLSKLEV